MIYLARKVKDVFIVILLITLFFNRGILFQLLGDFYATLLLVVHYVSRMLMP
jgi:hypothetical protein